MAALDADRCLTATQPEPAWLSSAEARGLELQKPLYGWHTVPRPECGQTCSELGSPQTFGRL